MNNMYDILDKMKLLEGRGSKPDFLDLDKDGDKTEPMKQAARQAKIDEVVGPDYDVPPGNPIPDGGPTISTPIKEKEMKEGASKTARMARIAKLCARDAFSNIDRKMFLKAAELFAAGDEQRGLDAIERMDTEARDDFYMGCENAGIPVPMDEVAPPGLQTAGGSIGGILGAGIGAALGGFAGSAATGAIFPGPEGAVPGAVAGGIAGAVKGAGVGGRLGRKATDFTHDQLVNLWRKASATLGGPEATLDFVHAHANAANKGRYSFNYQGKNYAVTMDEQQARQAMRDLDKMTGGDLGTRRVERDRQRVRDLYHDAKMIEADMDEGNDFTGARSAAIKAGKPTFSVRGKTYRVTGDTSDEKMMEKKGKTLWPGTPEYKAKFGDEMRTGDKRKSSTGGEIEKTASGVKHTRSYDDDEGEDKKADDGAPKKRGRPKGKPKGPERVTGKAWKHKGGRVKEGMEDEEMISLVDKGEYDREGDMAREQLHTAADAARELHDILDSDENLPEWVQSKITKAMDYLDTARDYMKASDSEDHEVTEVAPPGAKAERMVKHIKKGYAKDGRLTPKEKSIAYATAWKAKKAGRVEEESDETRDERAEKAGRRVAKDIEYDERDHDDIHGKRRGSEDDKAERAGKKVTKDIEYDEKKKKEEVDETTTSGSVATSDEAPKSKGKKGMIFGKGVYEGYEQRFNQLLTEGMSINMSVGEDGKKSLNVNATDDDAVKLAQILKLAGMEQASGYEQACSTCGQAPCGCESLEEADYANSPEETGADINTLVNTYSDGLDGQKTTGQTTIPVIAGQTQRMMSQVKEQAEQRLWDLYKHYESK